MPNPIFLMVFFALSFGAHMSAAFENGPVSLLVIDSKKTCELPRNFRTSESPFLAKVDEMPSRKGLDELNISGSAQFSKESLKAILETLGDSRPIVIVDLRKEYHLFINGIAVSWFAPRNWGNKNLDVALVKQEEKRLKESLKKLPKTNVNVIIEKLEGTSTISKSCEEEILINSVASESSVVKGLGAKYQRFFVVDHLHPDDQTVNDFLSFYQSLPKNTHLHFHCRAGKGRTTTFMVMVDILNNANHLSLKEILQRQALIGGADLAAKRSLDDWRIEISSHKHKFIKSFYKYVKDSNGDFSTPFSFKLAKNGTMKI